MTTRLPFLAALAAALVAACAGTPAATPAITQAPNAVALADPSATAETRALFEGLRGLAGRRVLFGHQDALAYGHDWSNEPGRSDVKDVAGAHPAVYGWDLGGLEKESPTNLDRVRFDRMRGWIVEGFRRGGVITLSWHMANPASGGGSWDTTAALASVLPGAPNHARYVAWLDRFAEFAGSLRAPTPRGDTVLVPIVFRPFHEMSGSWFWWGGRHVKPEDYRRLWRFTVEYLRDRKGAHNVLYAYSPDKLYDYGPAHFFDWYPGDAYVDVIGMDQYYWPASATWAPRDQVAALAESMRFIAREAAARGKIAAITETGFETIPDSTWWTRKLLAALKTDSLTRRMAWVLVWRNANQGSERRQHYYGPYRGHPSAPDFVRFDADPLIALEHELPDLYRVRSPRR